jgi:hypothetical protein
MSRVKRFGFAQTFLIEVEARIPDFDAAEEQDVLDCRQADYP